MKTQLAIARQSKDANEDENNDDNNNDAVCPTVCCGCCCWRCKHYTLQLGKRNAATTTYQNSLSLIALLISENVILSFVMLPHKNHQQQQRTSNNKQPQITTNNKHLKDVAD